jgi:hypothetical protein
MPIVTEFLESQIICSHYRGSISERQMMEVVRGKEEEMAKAQGADDCVLIVDLSQASQLDSIIGYLPLHLGSAAKSMKSTILVKPQDFMGSMLVTSMLSAASGLNLLICDSLSEALQRARKIAGSTATGRRTNGSEADALASLRKPPAKAPKKWWQFWK